MDAARIEATLAACEASLARSGSADLSALGFWKAVARVKRDGSLAERFADRMGRIDREAFLRGVRPFVFPAALGLTADVGGAALGAVLVAAAQSLAEPWRDLAYLAGAAALIGTTHTLAHWVVGTAVGMHFTHVFVRPPGKPQPGFKVDYATYLRTPARSRAWMHASGAIVTKTVPFAVAAAAEANGAAAWAVGLLVLIGIVQVLTDVTLSTRASDWMKFRREMRFAR